jgi:hypothetical protein
VQNQYSRRAALQVERAEDALSAQLLFVAGILMSRNVNVPTR